MEPKALAPHLARADAASRVKAWTRGRFGDVTVLVTELESAVPGFPPLRTVVAFWSAERKHYHFSIFKPLEQVTEPDLPPSWYRDALAVTPGVDCSCC
jgi:nitrate reductase delta subunit